MSKPSSAVMIGLGSFLPESFDELRSLVSDLRVYNDKPADLDELLSWFGDSEILLVSTHIEVPAEFFKRCPNLRYLGVHAKSTHRVDEAAARNAGVVLRHLSESTTWQTAEFCLALMLEVYRGLSPLDFSEYPQSLKGRHLGLLGFGSVAASLAQQAQSLGMRVSYCARSPKQESFGARYLTKEELLAQCEIISLHTPPHLEILRQDDFAGMQNCRLLINTCLGRVVEESSLHAWLAQGHFAAFDEVAALDWSELQKMPNIYLPRIPAWRTYESVRCRNQEMIAQLNVFLESQAR